MNALTDMHVISSGCSSPAINLKDTQLEHLEYLEISLVYYTIVKRSRLYGAQTVDCTKQSAFKAYVELGSRPFRQCGTSEMAVDSGFGKTGSHFGISTLALTVLLKRLRITYMYVAVLTGILVSLVANIFHNKQRLIQILYV